MTAQDFSLLRSLSRATGYLMSFPFTTCSYFSCPRLFVQTPTSSTPLSLYFAYSSLLCGMDAIHGPHQVAQKSTTTTLPFMFSALTAPLCHSESSSAGIGLPSNASCLARCASSSCQNQSFG